MTFDPSFHAVDPLDGTTNFAHRYPSFGVSVAGVLHMLPSFQIYILGSMAQFGLVLNPQWTSKPHSHPVLENSLG